MRKRVAFIMVTACILLITGCGALNSAERSFVWKCRMKKQESGGNWMK